MKKSAFFAFLLLGISCMFLGTPLALANNHSDSYWSFTLPRFQKNCYTGARTKTDKTAAYLSCKSVGKYAIQGWLQMSNGQECNSPKRVCYKGHSVKIPNYAYEQHGRSKVRMAIESSRKNFVQISASGYWSPDSI